MKAVDLNKEYNYENLKEMKIIDLEKIKSELQEKLYEAQKQKTILIQNILFLQNQIKIESA